MSAAQRRALAAHWSRFGLGGDERLDLDRVFGRSAPRTLEIGFGMGDTLLAAARAAPGRDFLGIEVHEPGIGRVLGALAREGLGNVRLLRGDAVTLVERCLAPGSLDAVWLLFPDPWPKKRHQKRRLIQPGFAAAVAARIRPGGHLRLATDCEDYARYIARVLAARPELRRTGTSRVAPAAPAPATSKFEARARRRGRPVWDLAYERI